MGGRKKEEREKVRGREAILESINAGDFVATWDGEWGYLLVNLAVLTSGGPEVVCPYN